jgi:carboxylesterase type B
MGSSVYVVLSSFISSSFQRLNIISNYPIAEGYFRPKTLPNSTVETLLHLYPSNPRQGCPYNTGETKLTSGTLDKKACSIFGDIVQIAPARMIAQQLAKHNGKEAPVYRYRFDQLPRNTSSLAKGITTGLEQSYVFSNLVPDFAWDQALAREMTSAWVSFAYSLDPNHGQGMYTRESTFWK